MIDPSGERATYRTLSGIVDVDQSNVPAEEVTVYAYIFLSSQGS
jgi:hypothetical protein